MPTPDTNYPWAFNSSSLMHLPLKDELPLLESFGWRAIEPHADKVQAELDAGATLPQVARRIADAGLRSVGMNYVMIRTQLDEAGLAAERDRVSRVLELTEALDAGGVTVVIGGPAGEDIVATTAALADKLAGYARIACRHGVDLRLEFAGGSPVSGSLDSAIDLIEQVNQPGLVLLFDLSHYFVTASHVESLSRLPAGLLTMIHLQDAPNLPMEQQAPDRRTFPGQGRMNVAKLVEMIRRETNYQGPYAFELYDEHVWAMPPRHVMEQIEKSIQHLEQAWGAVD